MDMTMEVKVELLCTATVPRMPIMRPTIGLDRNSLSPRRSAKEELTEERRKFPKRFSNINSDCNYLSLLPSPAERIWIASPGSR